MLTAIMVDGGFYRKRAKYLWGYKDPKSRADELSSYCLEHIKIAKRLEESDGLYRVFYYDSPCASGSAYHPLHKKNLNLKTNAVYQWTNSSYEEIKRKRKFALRLGWLSSATEFIIKPDSLRDVLNGKRTLESLTDFDFKLDIKQKGVDMKIGIDISSLVFKKQVSQIILIAGDSDFVPAAKQARREGIDFILDSMGQGIDQKLYEHIDGFRYPRNKIKPMTSNKRDT